MIPLVISAGDGVETPNANTSEFFKPDASICFCAISASFGNISAGSVLTLSNRSLCSICPLAVPKPIPILVPPTSTPNKYISFATKVLAVKHIKGKTFIVVDGSKHNLGEICEIKKLPIQVVRFSDRPETVKDADFVGYTCLEHDVLFKGFSGEIGVGDYIVFGNVGGYSNVSKPPFIKPNCCMISSNGNLIKRAETTEEVICTYE